MNLKIIDEREFNDIKPLDKAVTKYEPISELQMPELLEKMDNPVEAQKQMAVMINLYLQKKIRDEMLEKGVLSDHTRRWVETFNQILEKIQLALYGTKSTQVNLTHLKVSHADIAAKIREI